MKNIIELKLNRIVDCIYEKIVKSQFDSNYGLLSGEFGVLLFLLYYEKYSGKSHRDLDIYTERIVDNLLTRNIGYSFGDGLSGVLYLFEFLRDKKLLDFDTSDVEVLWHAYLNKSIQINMLNHNFDYLNGALGTVLYLLKKNNLEEADSFINYLYEIADKDIANKFFRWESIIYPANKKCYNLSLSHGHSSLIIFLSRFLKVKQNDSKAEELLNGAVNYVISQQIDFSSFGSHFPPYIINDSPLIKSRLAWCYGDLGVALALWQTGKVKDCLDLKNKALEIFLDSTKRTNPEKEAVIDSGICHGSIGLAMIYRRMYIDTGLDNFKSAMDFWIDQTLKNSQFIDGLAGFKTYKGSWESDYSFLTGISGIGLFFVSYLNNDSQEWDELLLLS